MRALRLRSEWNLEAFPVMYRLEASYDRQRRGIGNFLLVSRWRHPISPSRQVEYLR